MGAESITSPAPADDKSQNPGDIFHSFYHSCMIDVVIFNGVLFVSHAIGCFSKWNSIWLITGPFVSSFQLQFGWLRRKRWMVIPFCSTLYLGYFTFLLLGVPKLQFWRFEQNGLYRLRSRVGLLVFLGCYCLLPYYRILVSLQGLKEILFWVWDFFF